MKVIFHKSVSERFEERERERAGECVCERERWKKYIEEKVKKKLQKKMSNR